jgi:hypothetical protein
MRPPTTIAAWKRYSKTAPHERRDVRCRSRSYGNLIKVFTRRLLGIEKTFSRRGTMTKGVTFVTLAKGLPRLLPMLSHLVPPLTHTRTFTEPPTRSSRH